MQYVFFEKKTIYTVQWGLGQSPQKPGSFREFFVLKVTLRMYYLLIAPPIILLGCPPRVSPPWDVLYMGRLHGIGVLGDCRL